MSRQNIKDAVIGFLEQKKYKYLKPLGEGGFASVIAVLSPQKEVVAVKIVEKKNVRLIEDQVWPWLSHRNILPVLDVLSMDKPDVKMYITPMMPKALDEAVHNNQFRSDVNGLTKLKLWMIDALQGLISLHLSGLCHCDLKTDNVLIDDDERAVLCDFSGLNHTGKALENICGPLIYRPLECFDSIASQNIQGVPYDVYTFGLMALNMLTGHWPQIQLMQYTDENWSWSTHVKPILEKALKKQNFEYFIRSSLPYSIISERDIEQALDFLKSILKLRPEERPSAQDIVKHPFLKMGGNPFRSEKENNLLSKGGNPFRSEKENDLLSWGDTLTANPFSNVDDIQLSVKRKDNVQKIRTTKAGVGVVQIKYDMSLQTDKNSNLQSAEETAMKSRLDQSRDKCDPWQCLIENEPSDREKQKISHGVKKNIKQKVTDWFRKKLKKYKK